MEDSTKHTEDYTEDIYAYINRYIYMEDYNGKLHYIYLENYTNVKPARKNKPHGRTAWNNYAEICFQFCGRFIALQRKECTEELDGRIIRKFVSNSLENS